MLDPVDDGAFTYARTPGGRLVSQTNGTNDVLLTGLDRHGDLTWLFDPTSGTVTDTAAYDPYGDPIATTGGTAPTVGFQGDYTDPDSNQTWMGARWYSGADAVFRSRDTVYGELRTPVSLNRYTYGWASPLSFWDPDGHLITKPMLDGEYGSTEGAVLATQTRSARLAKNQKLMPWEFDDTQFGAAAASESIDAMSRQNFEDAGPSPETSSENVVNIVFIGGVGTGFSEEKSAMDLAQLLQVLHDAGVDANGYYTTWPSSKDVVVPFSGVGEADARMLACHDSGFWPPRLPLSIPHPEPSCFYEDYAPDLASDLRSSYEGLPGTTILFPHSEGVVATSFAFAEDDQAFTDVFDMVVLMSGAGAVTGGYEGYTDAGLPLVTAYDPHDPVVLNSMTYLPSMGDLESPLDIDGSQPLAIPMAGHSGLFDPENPTSKTLGRATADRLTATNDVVPFDPWTVWAPGADFGYQGMV